MKSKFKFLAKPYRGDTSYYEYHLQCAFALHNLIRFPNQLAFEEVTRELTKEGDDRVGYDLPTIYASTGREVDQDKWLSQLPENSLFHFLIKDTKKLNKNSNNNESDHENNSSNDSSPQSTDSQETEPDEDTNVQTLDPDSEVEANHTEEDEIPLKRKRKAPSKYSPDEINRQKRVRSEEN